MLRLNLKRGFFFALFFSVLITGTSISLAQPKKTAEENFKEGSRLYGERKFYKAIDAYNKAIELKPELAEAYYGRGAAYAMTGRLELAIADFDKIIEMDPSDNDAYYNKGFTYEVLGMNKEAIEQYKLFIEKANFQTPPDLIENTRRKIKKLERKLPKDAQKPDNN